MGNATFLSATEIQQNISALRELMQQRAWQAFYVSSYDPYLNEYVPLADCHRYYLTGFSGSVAEVLLPLEGKVRLYVDGRYHQQADSEVDPQWVEVIKVPSSQSNKSALLADLKLSAPKLLGLESDRIPLAYYRELQAICPVQAYELSAVIAFKALAAPSQIEFVEKEFRGRDTSEKLSEIFQDEGIGIYVTALDSIAWISNCRAYQLPHMSAFMAKALLTKSKVYIFY